VVAERCKVPGGICDRVWVPFFSWTGALKCPF